MKAHFILYVSNQTRSSQFYYEVLGVTPTLDVPGMTEFTLGESSILGLMPETAIKRLIGDNLPDPETARGTPRAELYLRVAFPEIYHQRAISAGAKELSPISNRTWGDRAGYLLDPDGHVIAFATPMQKAPTSVNVKSEVQRTFSGAPWEAKVGYCRAIRAGNIVAVTGTASVSDDGKIFAPGDAFRQAKRCFEIIEKAIQPLGCQRRHIIRTRMFVTDIKLWQEYGRAHAEFFEMTPPTTSMIEVKSLIDPEMLIEIEADGVICE